MIKRSLESEKAAREALRCLEYDMIGGKKLKVEIAAEMDTIDSEALKDVKQVC